MGTSLPVKDGTRKGTRRDRQSTDNKSIFYGTWRIFEAQDGLKWNSIFAFVAMGDYLRKGR